jgi:hypothetical protein
MAIPQLDPIAILADGLTLAYHEARNVRRLIEKGYVPAADWQMVVSSLSRDRVEAWKQLQDVRQVAREKRSVVDVAGVFEKRFGKNLAELDTLFQDPNWKHAKAWGGHAWRCVVGIIFNLGEAIKRSDAQEVRRLTVGLLVASHNNGCLRGKIVELDQAIGVITDPWWQIELLGA